MTTLTDPAAAVADTALYREPDGAYVSGRRGALLPWSWAGAEPADHDHSHTEVLLEPDGTDPVLAVRLRFLQLQLRHDGSGDRAGYSAGAYETVGHETRTVIALSELAGSDAHVVDVHVPGGDVRDGSDGATVRSRWPLHARLRLSAERLPGPHGALLLRIDVVNATGWSDPAATRELALRHGLLAAHTVLAVTGARFVSMRRPPEWAAGLAARCRNERAFPVLLGEPGAADLVLAAPVALDDHSGAPLTAAR